MKYILIVSLIIVMTSCSVCTTEEAVSVKGDTTFVKDTTSVDTAYQVRP